MSGSPPLIGRFVTVLLSKSWLGREDLTLEHDVRGEWPGTLNWALDGRQRLTETRRFTQSKAADAAAVTLKDLASPVGAFVRDLCV